MRILHLAYEDPRQPGSGGGSVRTREVDRRLAVHHEVTALVAGYSGGHTRVEDGIRWVPIGPARDGVISRLAYFALAGPHIRRYAPDVVVEDFGAPFGVALSPLFTARPVVASVQWLFARQMRAKYGLPFDMVQDLGLRLYRDFIAVSDWLAAEIRDRQPEARIETIPNGIEPTAFATNASPATHLLFVGRLDRQQKGTDLLLDVAALLAEGLGESMPTLLIAGDGPDRVAMEETVATRRLQRVIRFVGRVEGSAKYELIAGAHAVLMPSRFETFGLVGAETEAVGVPIVAFDVGPLAETIGPGGARLVPPFDTAAFAREAAALIADPIQRAELGRLGRRWAARYDWDLIASNVEAHLVRAAEARRPARRRPA